jgi:hypothetical protein
MSKELTSKKRNTLIIPLLIVGVLFFVIGFVVGISGFLTPFLKDALNLSLTESYMVSAAIFSAFVVFGIPAGWVIKKYGYKRSMLFSFFIMALGISQFVANGQSKPFVSFPGQLNDRSFAEWIAPNRDSEMGVYFFRKQFTLDSVPKHAIIHVSADNRYRLYVNDSLVLWGPAVGDIESWNYETVDIAPFLIPGDNIIASQVWNLGVLRGPRQITNRTAFILQGESKTEQLLNTNRSWLVTKDSGYFAIRMTDNITGKGYIAGGTDSLVASKHPWGWESIAYNDSDWEHPIEIGKGNHSGLNTWRGTPWKLQPRGIPFMEQKIEQIPHLLSVEGFNYKMSDYNGSLNMVIPPNTHAEILLDNKILTMGFPQLNVSGGKESKVKIQYQESLFHKDDTKGNRSEWKGKVMKGYYDVFISDGGKRFFEPLWIRTFRYAKLTIDTKDEALAINGFNNIFTAYPFKQKGSFYSDNDTLQKIWDVSWRTARLCALETYMDCPYYEQLQYIGDTRIQALISMYITGDDRLVKNAIKQIYNSMQPMGLTKSNHPENGIQIIPPFSLLFIGMIHDYYMLRDDSQFVKQYIPGIKFILDWFISKIADNGMLGPLPYWNYVDCPGEYTNCSPPGVTEGGSALISIMLAKAIDDAVEIFSQYGNQCDPLNYHIISESLKTNTLKLCFDEEKQLIAESPIMQFYSQHTNSFAILANMFDPKTEKIVAQKIVEDKTLLQASLYFKFYIFQALKKAGSGSSVINMMDQWKNFLDYGFTTFPEGGLNGRSDCHAWSAHPVYDFLNIICGIESSSPGFKTVRISPATGTLSNVNGKIPHPFGEISIDMKKDKRDNVFFKIHLPKGVTGELIYNNISHPLSSGQNDYDLNIKAK